MQLRDAVEVHAGDAYHKRIHHKDGGDGSHLPDHLAEVVGQDREVYVQRRRQQVTVGVQTIDHLTGCMPMHVAR